MRYASLFLFVTSAVHAGVILWDQSALRNPQGLVDQEFPEETAASSYIVNDVSVSQAWLVDSVTEYFSPFTRNNTPPSIPVRFNLFGMTANLPSTTDDPVAGTLMAANVTLAGSFFAFTVSGLNLSLAPGNYWIGITPIASNRLFGQTFYESSASIIGAPSGFRNPGNGFTFGSDWTTAHSIAFGDFTDGSLLITGTAAPEPSTLSFLLLGVGTLVIAELLRRAAIPRRLSSFPV